MSIFPSIFLVLFVLILGNFGTLSKSDRKITRTNKKTVQPTKMTVEMFTKRLIGNSTIGYRSILEEHTSFSVTRSVMRRFSNEVLGYVTPWNSQGSDVAKLFAAKFTMISPVWFQLQPKDSNGAVLIEGLQDIDDRWLLSMHNLNKNLKIVPRIIFEKWSYQSLKKLFQSKAAMEKACSKLINLAKDKEFDGYVVEIWNMLGGQMKKEATKFLIGVANTLRQNNLDFILVIPPPSYAAGQKGTFHREDFLNFVDHVTGFSLMTYDYSNSQRPGPNSPLTWLLQCIDDLVPNPSIEHRQKILLGLNFYGYDYSKLSSKAIVGHDYISLLKKHKPKIIYNNISGEHSFTYWSEDAEHLVFYPTYYSIQLRMQLAKDLAIGVSIWEIGQGLDYFYDLL